MKVFFLSLFFLISSFVFSQQTIAGKSYVMNEKKDYSFLDEVLKNKRIVLLGEQTHGDGATFDEKVNIIKHLNQRQGFSTVVFESGLYENYKACKLYAAKKAKSSIYNESIYPIWSNTQSFQNLLEFMDRRTILKDTIKIIGFDSQEGGSIFKQYFMGDLKVTFQDHQIAVPEGAFALIEKAFVTKDLKNFATNKKDSVDLYQQYDLILNSFKNIHSPSLDEKMMQQVFRSQIAQVDFEIKKLQKQKIAVQNPRDSQMAKNLIFLSELYPREKLICWGASYHFANNIKDFEYTDTTESYLKKQIELEKRFVDESVVKIESVKLLKKALPMGEILKVHFKNKLYSIAFTSYEGNYGIIGTTNYPFFDPPANSIEQKLINNGNDMVFLDFDKKDVGSYYCSALGNMPLKTKWNQVFDGLIFIRKSYPPKPITSDKKSGNNMLESFSVLGNIKDKNSNKAIANADVYLLNSNKSVVANNEGGFQFNVPRSSFNGKLVVSALGYYSDTIAVSKLENTKNEIIQIRLRKFDEGAILLQGMVVKGAQKNIKSLSAEKIVKNATKRILENYYQAPYNQKFFFRARTRENELVAFNEEAVLDTYSRNGFKGSNDAASNFYGELLQFRNTTKNPSKGNWTGIGYLGVVVFRNIILSQANVLYKTSSFDLKKEGVVMYDNRKVYVLSFVNKAPDVFTTGFGNPPPKYATGMIYIDAISFAVLKFEHYVVMHPELPNDNEGIIIESTHKITETFKLVDDKYFLNYCNEIVENKYLSKSDKKYLKESSTSYDLMSLNINTQNVKVIRRPIDRLKLGVELDEDPGILER